MSLTQIGRYRILERLGAGGMGEVYRAHDDQLQRDVAIKVLPETTAADPMARARLLREARAAAALNHPSICTIHEVGEADGHAYIAMELVEGRPLSDYVARGSLPIELILSYGRQIADALAQAHARHIIHRDLKSANVIVGEDSRIKVLDFGLAKRTTDADVTAAVTEVASPPSLTEVGTVVGTLAYMAPEQLRGEPADARSDLWALGVVLYELSAGRRPFGGVSQYDLTAKILGQKYEPLPASVPANLRVLIERCLEKQPARRFQSAAEVRAALDAIDGAAPRSSIVRADSRRLVWALAAMVVTAALAYVAFDRKFTHQSAPVTAARIESLAVLPLENLSGDSAQDYFADGMTEVLSTDLARLAGIKRVTARGSTMRYRKSDKPLDEIARDLKVDALVTGSVLRAGDRISITAQLLDPKTGDQIWSNRYERNLKDVLTLRNEIVASIVREIRAQLSPDERARLTAAATVNPEAFEAYLQARFYRLKQTPEDFDRAEKYLQIALDKDPNYALAWADLGMVWMMRGDAGMRPPSETFPKGRAYMEKAIALDDSQAEIHVALGNLLVATEWDLPGSEREFRRALAINPNHADAHFFLSDVLISVGRVDEAQREMQAALDLDPLNDFNWTYYGWHLNYLRRYEDAIPVFQRVLPTAPNRAAIHLGLWGAYHRLGSYEAALEAARQYFMATGDRAFADALGNARTAAEYRSAMKRTGDLMAAEAQARHVPALRVARMYAHAGMNDRALDWLERAVDNHESAMSRLAVVWDWVDLHDEPRFKELLRRLHLP